MAWLKEPQRETEAGVARAGTKVVAVVLHLVAQAKAKAATGNRRPSCRGLLTT